MSKPPPQFKLIPNGTTFQNKFHVEGVGTSVFTGTVKSHNPETNHYRVVYTDGDSEDISSKQLRRLVERSAPKKRPRDGTHTAHTHILTRCG